MRAISIFVLVALVAAVGARKAVRTLTSDNFDDLVGIGPWVVAFTAPWCGHCKKLKPVLEDAAKSLEGRVSFGNVDATQHRDLAVRFGVAGYPTVFHVTEGGEVRTVNIRHKSGIVEFAKTGFKRQEPISPWQSPMGPIATISSRVVKAGSWVASFDETIEEATGIPKVGIQFAMVLLSLMFAAFLVVVCAHVTNTMSTPQYRPYFKDFEARRRAHAD